MSGHPLPSKIRVLPKIFAAESPFAARGDSDVPYLAPARPGLGGRVRATGGHRIKPAIDPLSQASLSLTTREIAAERRFQLAASFSSSLRPSRVSE